ncbi:MAG: hypothetical protein CMK99_04490 [Pseudomonas sp.]|nr:hypothetical protein [Pseudomonas sp.]HBS77801.1 hypothetical protein [Pseudomonas sp.]
MNVRFGLCEAVKVRSAVLNQNTQTAMSGPINGSRVPLVGSVVAKSRAADSVFDGEFEHLRQRCVG